MLQFALNAGDWRLGNTANAVVLRPVARARCDSSPPQTLRVRGLPAGV